MQSATKSRLLCANNCGKRLPRQYRDYCSNECKLSAYRGWLIASWKNGTLKPAPFFNRTIRRHLIEILGEKCQRCGWNERNPASGNIPVEIEHIDGNWQNIAPENLTILCPNCHSLTRTFRGLNKGRGRPGRPGTVTSNVRTVADIRYPRRPPLDEVSDGQQDTSALFSEEVDSEPVLRERTARNRRKLQQLRAGQNPQFAGSLIS